MIEKLNMQTPNITEQNMEQIAKLFPNVMTETQDEKGNTQKAIDFDLLKQNLSSVLVEDSDERYRLDWPGKKAALLKANTPITKTLRPCREDSVNFDSTENVYIEGDNFEVLKILQESYLGKIKMIYIDPPYNTGKDFIYKDNFTAKKADYEEELGTTDENDNKLFKNTDTNGRFHSDWLSMMYERLVVARDLLKDDGVIFISIDDNEVHNLSQICEEVFGEENVKPIVVKMSEASGLKMGSVINSGSIPKLKEYVILAKKDGVSNLFFDKVSKGKWDSEYNIYLSNFSKEDKETIDNIQAKDVINSKDIEKLDSIATKVKLDSLSDILKQKGVESSKKEEWLFDNAWRICQCTTSASVLKLSEEKKKANNNELFFVISPTGVIYFVRANYSSDSRKPRLQLIFAEDNLEIHPGDFWSHIKTTGLDNEGGVPYKNGKKPLALLKALLKSNVGKEKDSIILDFFSGSASTAHAVMQLNQIESLNLKYLMVQLDEDLDCSLKKASGDTKKHIKESIEFLDVIGKSHILTELGKERIRRSGKKIIEDNQDKAGIDKLDIGFRVYKTDSSNMKEVYYHPEDLKQSKLPDLESNIKEDRSPDDLLTQVILDLGLELNLPIEQKTMHGNSVFIVQTNALVACFDDNINVKIIDDIAQLKPFKVVFKDASFTASKDRINREERFKRLSPETLITVI